MMLKNRWKKAACLILTIISTVCLGKVDVKAADYWPDAPETLSPGVILMEESTGTILYEKNSDEAHYPASITKIMTTLLALENGNLSDMVTFSDDAINNTEGSGIARDYGEQMTLEQCLYGVMLESANECAYAVAEHVGGTVENFVDMMNAKAKELGCTNTHFANPHGLQDENHYTTAHDMALIAQAAYQNETFRIIIGTKMYTIPPTNKHAEETVLRNHHDMLCTYHNANRKYLYPYCVGGKTGYTAAANSTLVTYAEKDGMTLICVVMNCTAGGQYADTRTLFDYCFENFKLYNVAQNETRYENTNKQENTLFTEWNAFAKVEDDAQIILPAAANFLDTQTDVNYDQAGGSILGTLVYSYGGRQVGTANVVTTGAKVAEYPFGEKSGTIQKSDSAKENDTSVAADSLDKTKSDVAKNDIGKKKSLSISRNKLLLAGGSVAVAIVIVLVIWFLINNHRRIWRRKNTRDRRYKTIRNNRKWNRRGGRK